MNYNCAVIGAGQWGTAVARLLAKNNQSVYLYSHEQHVVDEINVYRTNNSYLEGVPLPLKVVAGTDIAILSEISVIFIAIPVPYLRGVFERLAPVISTQHIVILSKGIECSTGMLPSQVLADVIGECSVSVMMGPNLAKELVQDSPMGTVVACLNKNTQELIASCINNDHVLVECTDDIIGVQLCGAFKNVIGIAVGMMSVLSKFENAQALLMTYGMRELTMLVEAYGGKPETVYGLAGLGDVLLTSHARNAQFGRLRAQGLSQKDAVLQFPSPPEGINTSKIIHNLAQQKNVRLAIAELVFQIIHEDADPALLLTVFSEY